MNIIKSIKFRLNKFINTQNDIQKSIIIPDSTSVRNSTIIGNIRLQEKTIIEQSKILKNISLGNSIYIKNSTIIGNVKIGNNCKLYSCELGGNIILGSYTSLWGPNLDIYTDQWEVEIGSFCSIARNVNIQVFNHNYHKITSYFIGRNFYNEQWDNEKISNGNTKVGNDVWIGAQCIILGGVTIGNGAIVSANSLVNKDIPPYAIVGGTPAKIIGYRFSKEIIDKLQEIQWWNWSEEKIRNTKELFTENLSIELLEKYSK